MGLRSVWIVAWILIAGAGSAVIVRNDIAERRSAFHGDAAIAHRLLSQRTAQHDAILGMLALLDPQIERGAEQRLSAFYPQVLAVARVAGDGQQPVPPAGAAASLAQAIARSGLLGHPVVDGFDAHAGRYLLVHASRPASHALSIDIRAMVPWNEWPIPAGGTVRVELRLAERSLTLQPGLAPSLAPFGLTDGFLFDKPLASASQPFGLRLQLAAGPVQWPWRRLSVWMIVSAAASGLLFALQRSRQARRRADTRLRLGKVANLNAMGELAGQMAHELNQPLSAALANAQAARRMLDDALAEPEAAIGRAKEAISQAAAQSRRAAEVVGRLRRLVEAPATVSMAEFVELLPALKAVLDLFEPKRSALNVRLSITGRSPPVRADPVMLEQILHNLVDNAFVALTAVKPDERRLVCMLSGDGADAELVIRDSGPGFDLATLEHLFEPFFTTRPGGIGLGLSLSRNLAEAMGGSLEARNASTRGAELALRLPLRPTDEIA